MEEKKNPDGGESNSPELEELSKKVRAQVEKEENEKKEKRARSKNPKPSLKSVGVGSVPKRKGHRKTEKLIGSAQYLLLQNKSGYEDYIRAYRILYDCDPDTEDVDNDFPFDDY